MGTDLQLPRDLITEILLYLPVKSLVRFKCVSKPWRSLISSPQFIKSHYSTSLKDVHHFNHQLLFVDKTPPNSRLKHCSLSAALHNFSADVSDVEYPTPGYLYIVGILNGLVCLSVGAQDLYIYNPILKRSRHLPSSISGITDLDFIVHGFGYDESNDDYKVVKVMRFHDRFGVDQFMTKVYSLRSDSWRRIEGFEGGNDFGDGNYADGKILWTNHWSKILSEESWKIVSLDIASYKYEEVKVPYYETPFPRYEIASLGGSLYLLCCWFNRAAELWVMDENGVQNSWSKVFFLDYNDCVHDPRPKFYYLKKVVGNLGDGEIVLEDTMGLIVYRTKTKDFRKIQLDGNLCCEFFVYVESLVGL